MPVEYAAVEVRHLAQQDYKLGWPVSLGFAQAFVEQPQQELAVEPLELVGAVLFLHHLQAVAQVMLVAVQEALLLDEVDEHQPVQHQGGVPVLVTLRGNSGDELLEVGQLLAEPLVETLGYALDVQGLAESLGYVGDSQAAFFL